MDNTMESSAVFRGRTDINMRRTSYDISGAVSMLAKDGPVGHQSYHQGSASNSGLLAVQQSSQQEDAVTTVALLKMVQDLQKHLLTTQMELLALREEVKELKADRNHKSDDNHDPKNDDSFKFAEN